MDTNIVFCKIEVTNLEIGGLIEKRTYNGSAF